MFELKLIPHSGVTEKDLNEIIKIKSVAWPFSYEDQVNWMNLNLKESDLHVLLVMKGTIVAYLNLKTIEIIINGKSFNGLGVGNVCAREQGKGWGKELMVQCNSFIEKSNKIGLLFCKEKLVAFYTRCTWQKIDNAKLKVEFTNKDIFSMYFNFTDPVQLMEYKGRQF